MTLGKLLVQRGKRGRWYLRVAVPRPLQDAWGKRERIKALGKHARVAINPATPACVLEEILPEVDQILVMTVDPGFGHQPFLSSTLPKIRRVRELMARLSAECDVEVDGGIDETTAPLAVAAGANVLVAGTSIFGNSDGVAKAMKQLRDAAAKT